MSYRSSVILPCVVSVLLCAAAALADEGGQAPSPAYAKDAVQTCLLQCHNKAPVPFVLQTPHAVKADENTPFAQHQCETCHGASPEHVITTSTPTAVVYKGLLVSPVAARNSTCLSCHEWGMRVNWQGSQHESRGVACNDCHNIHAPDEKVRGKATQADVCFTCHKAQRAQTRRISTHALAVTGLGGPAKMVCSDCHNPHGSTGPTLLIRNSVNETCYTCHAEKRGPFLWEHAPVADTCTNCHTPHGSTNAPLLKTRAPWLCQQCHSGDHGAQVNSGANLAEGNVTTVKWNTEAGSGRSACSSGRSCLLELSRADPWFEPSGRRQVPALTTFKRGRCHDNEREWIYHPDLGSGRTRRAHSDGPGDLHEQCGGARHRGTGQADQHGRGRRR